MILQRIQTAGIAALLMAGAAQAQAATEAYWRFEAGPVDTNVVHLAGDNAGNTWSADIPDVSGNGNDLSAWITGGCCGYAYRSDVATGTIAATGAANNFSVQNTGGGPGMFTGDTAIKTITPTAFTVEASFKLENGGYRTIVGRDSTDVADVNRELAAVYLQALPGNALAIKYADQDGYFHEAISPTGALNTFAFPNSAEGDWYHAAGVSDGSKLSLYLANATQGTGYQLIAQVDLLASGSTNTAMAIPAGDGGDWNAGNWTVGRGMFNGGHGDRAYGLIDEVRISSNAVALTDMLHFGAGQNLSIEVNTTTGAVTLKNNSSGAVTLDYYEITSEAGALRKNNWNSLDDQNIAVRPPGDFSGNGVVDAADYTVWRDNIGGIYGPADYDVWAENYGANNANGYGWTEAGGSDANILSELLLDTAGTTVLPGQSIPLGTAYNTAIGGQDLQFSYGRPGSGLFVGGVTYVNAAVAVPEPATLALVALGVAALGWRRAA